MLPFIPQSTSTSLDIGGADAPIVSENPKLETGDDGLD